MHEFGKLKWFYQLLMQSYGGLMYYRILYMISLVIAYSDEKLTPFRPDVDRGSGDMLTPVPVGC